LAVGEFLEPASRPRYPHADVDVGMLLLEIRGNRFRDQVNGAGTVDLDVALQSRFLGTAFAHLAGRGVATHRRKPDQTKSRGTDDRQGSLASHVFLPKDGGGKRVACLEIAGTIYGARASKR